MVHTCEFCGQSFSKRGKPSPGNPHRFCSPRCWYKFNKGANNYRYRGHIPRKHPRGYIEVYVGRERTKWGKMKQHILVAEAALGKKFPVGAVMHHVDGNATNNGVENLVMCENQSYHKLLHLRAKRLRDFGRFDAKKCWYCQRVKTLDGFYRDSSVALDGRSPICKTCSDKRRRARLVA